MDEVNEHLNSLAATTVLAEAPVQVVGDELETAVTALDTDEPAIISRNVEELTTVGASLESYINAFMSRVEPGNWDRRVARQFELGIESIARASGVSMEAIGFEPSFEDVGTTKTGEEHKKESKEKSKGILRRIWDAILRAIKRAKEFILGFFDKVRKAQNWFLKAHDNIKSLVIKAKQNGMRDAEIKGSPSWSKYLVKKDAGSLLAPAAAIELTASECELVAKAMAHDVAVGFDAAGQYFSNAVGNNIDEDMSNKFGIPAGQKLHIPELKIPHLSWPIEIPGGVSLDVSGVEKGSGIKNSGHIGSSMSMLNAVEAIKVNKTTKDVKAEGVKYMTLTELERLSGVFDKISFVVNEILQAAEKEVAEYDKAYNFINNNTGKMGEKYEGADQYIYPKLMAVNNSVVNMLVVILFDNAKMAYNHAAASVK